MGSESQIRAFLEKWKEQQISASEIQYVVFSEHFTSQPEILRVANAKSSSKKNLFEDKQLPKFDNRLQEIGIANVKENVQLTIPGKFQPYPYSCDLKKDALEKLVKIFALNDEGEWQEQEGKWQQQESKGSSISFAFCEDNNGNNCELKLVFQPEGTLPQGRIGLIQVQVIPSRNNVDLPTWISEWDMGNIDIAPEQFDGAKTVNLQRIASSLKDSLLSVARPTIVELDLLVDRR